MQYRRVPQGLLTSILILGILMPGCRRAVTPVQDADSLATAFVDSLDVSELRMREWVDSVMAGMTLEEMAGQLIYPAVYSDDSGYAMRSVVRYVADCHVGGVVLLKGTPEAARLISDTLSKISCAPPFVSIDAEWGLAMRLKNTPRFPRNGKISPAARDSILYEYGVEVARECREVGINMVLGPVLDVLPEENGKDTFIGSRSFGSDAMRVTRHGVSYAKGLEDGGVISVAKHFPGHGSADADSHKRLPTVSKSREQLFDSDLKPFMEYAGNNLSAIMVGHLYVPALDSEDIPVSVSEKILKGFVRDEMGFRGLIITDAMNMAGAGGKSGADAIMAGADMVLAPRDTHREVMSLVEAVEHDVFPLESLRDRVRRVLSYKFRVKNMASGVQNTIKLHEIQKRLIQKG